MPRGQSTVETMFAISAPFVALVVAGWLFPAQLDALVQGVGDWVGTWMEIP